jgi:hypothetical protein
MYNYSKSTSALVDIFWVSQYQIWPNDDWNTKRLPIGRINLVDSAEMLAEIFMSFVALTEYRSRTELDTREAAWKLGQICNRWRAVAITTPRLWRIMALRLHTDPWNTYLPTIARKPSALGHTFPPALGQIVLSPCILPENDPAVPCPRSAHEGITSVGECRTQPPSGHALDLHPIKGRLQSLLSLSIQPLLLPKYQRKNFTLPALDAFEDAPRL